MSPGGRQHSAASWRPGRPPPPSQGQERAADGPSPHHARPHGDGLRETCTCVWLRRAPPQPPPCAEGSSLHPSPLVPVIKQLPEPAATRVSPDTTPPLTCVHALLRHCTPTSARSTPRLCQRLCACVRACICVCVSACALLWGRVWNFPQALKWVWNCTPCCSTIFAHIMALNGSRAPPDSLGCRPTRRGCWCPTSGCSSSSLSL